MYLVPKGGAGGAESRGESVLAQAGKPRSWLHHTLILENFCCLVAQMVKKLHVVQETRVPSLGQKASPGEGNGNPLQYSCLENSMDREAWRDISMGFQRAGHS